MSLPHSPSSETNLPSNQGLQAHPPLRIARSAEILTPVARRKFFYSPEGESERRKSDVNNPMNRPKFHLVIDNSPSPPEVNKSPRMSRTQRNTLSRDHSSPDLTRPHSIHIERPHSELYTTPKTLSIPTPDYARQYSNNSRASPSRSEGLYSGNRAGSTSPRVTSSIQRPLNFNRATPEGENEWQKNRWRQWDDVTSQKPNDGFEQETLV